MRNTQRKIINTLRTAMKYGALEASKKHDVSEATVHIWAKRANVVLAKNQSKSVDWTQITNLLNK